MVKRSREKTVKQLIRLCRNTEGGDDDHEGSSLLIFFMLIIDMMTLYRPLMMLVKVKVMAGKGG